MKKNAEEFEAVTTYLKDGTAIGSRILENDHKRSETMAVLEQGWDQAGSIGGIQI